MRFAKKMRHYRKNAFTNAAYVDPNMESIFKFNNLMFCHISVIKDDCSIVAYGCFFFAWTSSSEWRGKPNVDAKSPALSLLLMLRIILFESLTNLSILMINFTELIAADDYLNLTFQKCTLVSVH